MKSEKLQVLLWMNSPLKMESKLANCKLSKEAMEIGSDVDGAGGGSRRQGDTIKDKGKKTKNNQ
jgi:hypothetical protein